jgi:deoxyribonuclease-4
MFVGAHVSSAGGVEKAVDRALEIGAECIQIFASPPRTWAAKPIPDASAAAFRAAVKKAGLGPTALHAVYLVGIGSPGEGILEKSILSLTGHLRASEQLGALGLIFHPASHLGQGLDKMFDQFVNAARQVLKAAPGESLLMLETSAGQGDHIGSKFSELGRLIKAIRDPRVAVCFDTQHVWAAGYNIVEKRGMDDTMAEFDREIGLKLLRAVHANDSMKEMGSAVDRHDNIGEGLIGKAGFLTVLKHPAFKGLPFYLEVPGAEGQGPDKKNVDALKALRKKAAA